MKDFFVSMFRNEKHKPLVSSVPFHQCLYLFLPVSGKKIKIWSLKNRPVSSELNSKIKLSRYFGHFFNFLNISKKIA